MTQPSSQATGNHRPNDATICLALDEGADADVARRSELVAELKKLQESLVEQVGGNQLAGDELRALLRIDGAARHCQQALQNSRNERLAFPFRRYLKEASNSRRSLFSSHPLSQPGPQCSSDMEMWFTRRTGAADARQTINLLLAIEAFTLALSRTQSYGSKCQLEQSLTGLLSLIDDRAMMSATMNAVFATLEQNLAAFLALHSYLAEFAATR